MTEAGAQDQVTLTVDDRQATVPKGTLILKAAEQLGIEIPVFCYHDKLKPIGACRMCLVDVEGSPKPVPSCATEVIDGMVVRTRTPEVQQMWKSVLEFLLVNHPLDCPVCDRGGECPLQDNTFKYGPPDSQFTGEKRHFKKPVPLSDRVVLDRERCIMCTRCVRFCQEISEHEQLKIWDRGYGEYIDTFPGATFDSNFSGNTIELCPVGALLSRVFRFKARPWEIKHTPSVCPHCAVGCNIVVDARNNRQVVRFLSRENAEVDDGWLCDRGRFDSDFPNSPERLTKPLVRKNGELTEVDWPEALDAVAEGLKNAAEAGPDKVGAIGSPWRTNEDNYLLQKLFRSALKSNSLDFTLRSRLGGVDATAEAYRSGFFDGFIRDTTTADVICAFGCDIAVDAPILDLWLKKARRRGAKLINSGATAADLAGQAEILANAQQPLLLLGAATLQGENGRNLLDALWQLKKQTNSVDGRNMRVCAILPETNAQGAMDVGMLPGCYPGYRRTGDELPAGAPPMSGEQMLEAASKGNIQAMYIMGQDPAGDSERGPEAAEALKKVAFLVVADTFLTETAALAHVVLPSCTFAEKEGTFTNTERRVQRINPAMRIVGESRPDWAILSEIANRLGISESYKRAEDVFEEMARVIPQYADMDYSSIGSNGRQWREDHIDK
jgi:NADH-quinone oxidoreductase subunit G